MASPTAPAALPLILFSGGFDRVHYGLVLASSAAASGRAVSIFLTGRAVPLALAAHQGMEPGWLTLDPAEDGSPPGARAAALAAAGVAHLEELLQACPALGVQVSVCEMAVQGLGLPPDPVWRPELSVRVTGLVTFLNDACRERSPVFV